MADGKMSYTGHKFFKEQTVAVLLNLDSKSPNANTISLFRNGERLTQPHPVPASLQGKTLFPHISFRNVSVQVASCDESGPRLREDLVGRDPGREPSRRKRSNFPSVGGAHLHRHEDGGKQEGDTSEKCVRSLVCVCACRVYEGWRGWPRDKSTWRRGGGGAPPRAVLAGHRAGPQGLAAGGAQLHPRCRGAVASQRQTPQARPSPVLATPYSPPFSFLPSLLLLLLHATAPVVRFLHTDLTR